jgi:hypothetical protein
MSFYSIGIVHLCAKKWKDNNTFGYWIIMRVDEWIKRFVELNTLYEL